MIGPIHLQQVPRIVFGSGCFAQCSEWLQQRSAHRVFIITSPSNRAHAETLARSISAAAIESTVRAEPTVALFQQVLRAAQAFQPDAIVGLGGGSPLDLAKLIAALTHSTQVLDDVFGIGLLASRSLPLLCIPTTSGTGSEVSPNAILLDHDAKQKKAVISPHLVPDAAFIDPALTLSVPPLVTAATGVDALSHCIEAYANRNAHPLINLYAFEGIRRISGALVQAVSDPSNLSAREDLAMGSLCGGLCLGPVNTAAVHALSYPLGAWFGVPHGQANALLLPHVLAFNLPANPSLYRDIAVALGTPETGSATDDAHAGLVRLRKLLQDARLTLRMRDVLPSRQPLAAMAESALGITRLMKNNLRQMTRSEAIAIYEQTW